MLEKSKITEFPVELRKYCVSDLSVRNEDQAIILYTPNAKLSETAQPGFISKNQLDNLTKRLSKRYDTKCDVIYLKSDKLEFLSKGFETLLSAKFAMLSVISPPFPASFKNL